MVGEAPAGAGHVMTLEPMAAQPVPAPLATAGVPFSVLWQREVHVVCHVGFREVLGLPVAA